MRKAVAIVVGDGVVHPGAHGDLPSRQNESARAFVVTFGMNCNASSLVRLGFSGR